MSRKVLDANIDAIRRYTAEHAELRAAHHFLYDLPLEKSAGCPEIVVMGINPGETQKDRDACPGPTEETSLYDFHEHSKAGRSRGSRRWRELTSKFTSGRPVVFSELFFWSSRNHEELVSRFHSLWDSPHLPFCVSMNRALLDAYKPKAVVFVGLSNAAKAALTFGLTYVETHRDGETRVVEHYQDNHRPWFFTKHWTGSRGFTKSQREAVRSYLSSNLV